MKIREFEQKIGYQFQNRDYLETALTHSSFNREKNTKHQDNERLEFLGDAFFDAVISVELFARMQHVTEGKLTKTRALIVCESTLAKIARGYDLGSYLKLGHGEDTGAADTRIRSWQTAWRRSSARCIWTAATKRCSSS